MNINRRHIFVAAALGLVMFLIGSTLSGRTEVLDFLQARPSAEDSAFEASQTAKLLGVPVQNFPAPQGLTAFDELPTNARAFTFTLKEQPRSGPPPPVYFDERKIVTARAPDGTVYEAYCGHDDASEIVPGHGFVSNFENRRQWYENHLGYGYMPQDVYIGKREAGRIRPTLFFRDVGSHTTAPHYLAIDNQGRIHLAVADVNISQDNRLDLYWVIGDPKTGKWNAAWLIDRRGFTSWSHPWSAAWSNKVQLIWDWCDVSINKRAPGMGAFHVEWTANGFGRKTRIFSEPVRQLDAAVDQASGLLVIVLARDAGGVYVLSRSADGKWTRPSLLHPSLRGGANVSIEAAGSGTFIIKAGSDSLIGGVDDSKQWLLRPQQ
ncbi:MAG TPA: hypothetical protein VHE60_04370 [Pyrinomonadaceae bacterium]|nr:hypothetical protein [Pyrinomonadaceae bacterium]